MTRVLEFPGAVTPASTREAAAPSHPVDWFTRGRVAAVQDLLAHTHEAEEVARLTQRQHELAAPAAHARAMGASEDARAPRLSMAAPALARGVYEAPYYDATGAVMLFAVTESGRQLSCYRACTDEDYTRLHAQLWHELDQHDPPGLRLER
ncbi:MAG: hypothetical protein HYV19_04235 [Gemmatimonadetes bacterium]|nr:hypothetical protein [Gemmatimonadota bacterium]